MSKLLDEIAKINKELKLGEGHERPHQEKINYVTIQVDEIRAIMWRLRVDLLLNQAIEAVGDQQVEEQAAKTRTIKNDLRQMGKAVNTLIELETELNSEPAKV